MEQALSFDDALYAYTQIGAELSGWGDQIGSITVGKYADFFLVPGNPLEDISAIRQIRLVSRGEQIYFPSEIYDALAIEPFVDPVTLSVSE